jgi:hypothetical protein
MRKLVIMTLLMTAVTASSCATETGRLTADQEQRLAAETIVRRANNQTFHATHDAGRRDAGWRNRLASIVITRRTLLIHRNGEVLLLLNSRTRRFCEVHRDANRIRIRAGSGGAAETWSFAPPNDPEGWATDVRAVIRASNSVANPRDGGQ